MSTSLSVFLRSLQTPTGPNIFNPWRDHDPATDLQLDAPKRRLQRLKAHLIPDARYLLVGEAAGYQGCKVTGIPFTSERLIGEGAIPRIEITSGRLTSRPRPWSEPSATIVWGTLHALCIADKTILWNAYPWHPHKPNNRHSNRTPTRTERTAGIAALQALLNAYPAIRVFAVGRNAEAALGEIGQSATALRHPSMGGATIFREQLRKHTRAQRSQPFHP